MSRTTRQMCHHDANDHRPRLLGMIFKQASPLLLLGLLSGLARGNVQWGVEYRDVSAGGAHAVQKGDREIGDANNDRSEEKSKATRTSEDKGQKSLVHLRDGRILRVRARVLGDSSNETWQVRQGRDWVTLPAGMVERVVLEREVLKTARKLARELRSPRRGQSQTDASLGRRVAYASWLLDEGLMAEAAEELGRVLGQDSDHPLALDLLPRLPLATGLPAIDIRPAQLERSLQSFCQAAARGNVLVAEVAVQRLADAAEKIPDLQERLGEELHNRTTRRRVFAAHALRRIFPGQEVRPLLRRAILDASSSVRAEASLALGDVGNEAVLAPVVRALGSQQPLVRDHAVQAMALMGYPAAVEPLVGHLAALQSGGSSRPPHANLFVGRQFAYVQDFDVEVAQGSAIADPIINVGVEGVVLDAAVVSSSTLRIQTELANTRRALTQLTGHNPGHSVRAWQNWWAEKGDAWKADKPSSPYAAPESPDR